MRAYGAAEFTLTHFGAWRWALRLLGGLVGSAIVAWTAADGSPVRPIGWPLAATALLALLALLVWLWVVQPGRAPVCLRWDGRVWSLGGVGLARAGLPSGDLRVAIDLGIWMLLRFVAADPSVRPRVAWVAAQRAGHAAQWHALRCAVYSPRPDAGADAAPDV